MNVIETSQRQREAVDGALAAAIIRAWKADAALRAELRSINTYSAFVRGRSDERAKIMAAPLDGTDADRRPPPPATVAQPIPAAVSAKIASGIAAAAESADHAKPMSSREAGMHLSARFTYHAQRLAQTGMSHGAASIEARRLVAAERASIERAQG